MAYDIRDTDITTFLADRGVKYYTEGKNISPGWIGIKCPFCADHSNHCGINLESNVFTCWICAEKGNVVKLISEIESCSYQEAVQIARQFGKDFTRLDAKPLLFEGGTGHRVQEVLPNTSQDYLPKIHTEYLQSRNFSPKYLQHKYKIKAVHTIGKYRFRIIVPFFLRGRTVTFVARDVTRSRTPYLNASRKESIVSVKSTLYNIDNAEKRVVLVEGVTDVWRIGDGAIANAGLTFTDEQVAMMMERGIKEVFIVFDEGAEATANDYSDALASVINKVHVVLLPKGDPAEQPPDIVDEIRRLIR